ncbi:hypothetical protein OH491_15265 [Termitidicoccus mucosus]|uniref:hypothetical protein n=1 Tax=Termitidicoccus mucosus TaxID=1184151 RepID=UPI00318369FE
MFKRSAKISERFIAFILNLITVGMYVAILKRSLLVWLGDDLKTYTFLGFGCFYLMHLLLVLLLCICMYRFNGSFWGLVFGLRFQNQGKEGLSKMNFCIRSVPTILFLVGGVGRMLDVMTPFKEKLYPIFVSLSILIVFMSSLVVLITRKYSLLDMVSRTEVMKFIDATNAKNINENKL